MTIDIDLAKGKDETVAFCPSCGRLEIKDGKIIHPEMDKLIAKAVEIGFMTSYVGN